ncbi:hypothetical protein DFP72DRAFT_1041797 [Ephemerocybe angulata]|uniref:RING-type E3 ubiquitin transferase n=1 Tax=Ephemerocybe angulata TaxID=980116 RepID=A0A8H6MDY9_9AGAR|nr:hypothetical protein DFP72DRAFT_1041797 [Tulosesus angulatus]
MDTNRDEETGDAQTAQAGAQQPPQPRQRASVPSFLFLSFVLFMLTSHNGDEFLARHQHQDALQNLTWQLGNYSAWMNGTESNFTIPDRDSTLSPLLDSFKLQGVELDPFENSYYSNVTGFIHGTTQFHNITPPALTANHSLPWMPIAENYTQGLNMTEVLGKLGAWNWTATGKVALSVVEKKPLGVDGNLMSKSKLALVHGRIELTDVDTAEDLRLEFEGVHFLSNGSIYGFAEPNGREIDIRLLPSLVPDSARNETAEIIGPELDARITKLKNLIDAGVVDESSSDDEPKTSCPFTFFGQIHSVPVPEYLMQELEEEIQTPTGITTANPPPLSMTGILVSKECGLLYEILDTEGLRSRTFFRKVTTYAGFSGLAYLIILILFSRQVERSRTPSGVSRVSKWTSLSQATMDSVSFAGHITFAILAEGRPSLSLIAPAFLACMLFVQEAQFFALVNQIQGPENYTPPTPPPPASTPSPTPTPPSTNASDPSLPTVMPTARPPPTPAPAAAVPPPSPQSMSFWEFLIHHIRTDPQARLWVTLFIFLTLIVRVILSPTLSMIFVAATYSMIWLPQIVRSARRGRTSGLSKEYIIGVTACRLYSALYFLMCPRNVLEVEPRSWAPFLAFFVIFQAALLMLQDTIGPSFFLPARFKEAKIYDYHPPLPLPDAESPDQSLGDCAICMDAIHVDPALRQRAPRKSNEYPEEKKSALGLGAGSSAGAGAMSSGLLSAVGNASARKSYSLAPCHHLFHTECLEKWLAIKNICPHCRRPLPPL